MHYYQFNIGDYQSHAKHLTPMEDICYRRLLDWYYLHEKPIPNDIPRMTKLLMLNGCSTDVESVLNEFFTLVENTWINVRADNEILAYYGKKAQNSLAGKASAAKRMAVAQHPLNGRRVSVEPNKKQETRNIYIPPIPDNLLKDFLVVRKNKHAGQLTETAFKGIEKEATKAGISAIQAIEICCTRGWVGFNASWLTPTDIKKPKGLAL